MANKNILLAPLVIWSIAGILGIALMMPRVYELILNKKGASDNTNDIRIDRSTYQAVFLNNNQIYFGRLSYLSSDYPILSDVYYVQINDQASKSGKVVPLGDIEPHRPQNQMIINKNDILFIENLKNDSPVIKAIQNLKSQR